MLLMYIYIARSAISLTFCQMKWNLFFIGDYKGVEYIKQQVNSQFTLKANVLQENGQV